MTQTLASANHPFFSYGIGAAVGTASLNDPRIRGLLASEFSSTTPENAAKWSAVEPKAGEFRWNDLDALLLLAHAHGLGVRLHAPVWHRSTPTWVFEGSGPGGLASPEELRARLAKYFQELLHHVVPNTGGRTVASLVYAWDVVNEAIQDGPTGAFRGPSDSKWALCWPEMETLSTSAGELAVPAYLTFAFRTARSVADHTNPAIHLYYNDYGTDQPVKGGTILGLLEGLRRGGVPVDGLGIQGHWTLGHFFPSPCSDQFLDGPDSVYRRIALQLEQLERIGFRVQITELDLAVASSTNHPGKFSLAPTLADYERIYLPLQAQAYRQLLNLFRAHGDRVGGRVEGVSFWGVTDDDTWLDLTPDYRKKDPTKKTRPLIWFSVEERFGSRKEPLWAALTEGS